MSFKTASSVLGGLRGILRIKRGTAIVSLTLFIIVMLSVLVRVQPMKWGFQLSEFDPYFHYSVTKHIVDYGFPSWTWHTDRSWYPQGRDIGTTSFPGLPFSAATFYYFLTALGFKVTVYDACIIFPVLMAAITCIVIYFVGKEVGGSEVGLLCSLFLALNPAYIGRTSLGFFDDETVGIFGIALLFLFYLRSLNAEKNLMSNVSYAVGAGLSLGFISASWGASRYPLSLLALINLVLLVLKGYSRRLLTSYGVLMGVGLLITVSVPKLGFRFISEFETLIAIGMFLVLCMFEALSFIKNRRSKIVFVSCFFGIMATAAFFMQHYGIITFPVEKFISVINPFSVSRSPLVASVQEGRPATWSSFYYQFGALVFLVPLGFYFACRKPTEKNISIMIYALTSLYFSGSMIRLTIVMAPAFCVLGALALAEILKPFLSIAREQGPRRRRRFIPRVEKGYSLILVVSLFIVVGYPLMRGVDYGYSPTTIAASSIPIRTNIDDWPEALTWMKYNIPRDTVVVSWWDYGYWITMLGDKITLTDNGTLNGTQIAQVGRMFMSNETIALTILKQYDAKYVVVFTTIGVAQQSPILYGDEVKWRWMAKIGGMNDTALEDVSIPRQLSTIWGSEDEPLSWLYDFAIPKSYTVLTKLMIYGAFGSTFAQSFQAIPVYFDLIFSSSNRLVFIYKIAT